MGRARDAKKFFSQTRFVERRDGRVRADFCRSQQSRDVGRVLARWHEGGVDELRRDPAAVARRVRIELPTCLLDDEMNRVYLTVSAL